MTTDTQKEFKKQMKELQKQKNNSDSNQFYSYVEKDYIDNYYTKKKKARIRNIGIASIIPLALGVYSIFTWIQPLINEPSSINYLTSSNVSNNMQPNGNINPISLIKTNKLIKKHEKIIDYISKIDSSDKEILDMLNQRFEEFKNVQNNLTLKKSYIEMLQNDKVRMKAIISEKVKLECPEEFSLHHNTVIEKYNTYYEQLLYLIDATKTNSQESINKINLLNDKIKLYAEQQIQALLKGFDATNIKYEVKEDGNIRYWYKR